MICTAVNSLDVETLRADFPILSRSMNGHPLVYLDSASTSQKPEAVISAIADHYRTSNANIHRGVYRLSEEATDRYELARSKVAAFINARSPEEIVFVRNTTEAINLVSYAWGRSNVGPGDHILTSILEHHSNLLPWQALAQEKGARLDFMEVDGQGVLALEDMDRWLSPGTRLVSVTHVSNALGTINPVKAIVRAAHSVGALALIDGAQSAPHMPVDVQELDCDFLAFSGHKMLGPMGIGVLYGKREHLEAMDPFLRGGDMIRSVTLQCASWNSLPWKFEAGTPAVPDVFGLGAAVDYLSGVGMEAVHQHDKKFTAYILDRLQAMGGVDCYGPPLERRSGVVSFNLQDVHPHDVATVLDSAGVCIRAGHHCCQPLMVRMGVAATCRASTYLYNTYEEADALVAALEQAKGIFGGSAI